MGIGWCEVAAMVFPASASVLMLAASR